MGDKSGTTDRSAVGGLAVERAGSGVPGVAVDNGGLARLIPHFRRLCGEVAAIEAAHAITRAHGFTNTFDAVAALDSERKLLADILEGTPLARDGGSKADTPISVPPDKHPERRAAADREILERAQSTLDLGETVICYEEGGDIKRVVSARERLEDLLAGSYIKGPDMRADIMDCIVLLTNHIGDRSSMQCLACVGERMPYIHPNDPTRKFERCGACGGAGEIEIKVDA